VAARLFLAGTDLVRIQGGGVRVVALARRLWEEVEPGAGDPALPGIRLRIDVTEGTVRGDPERGASWSLGRDEVRLDAPGIGLLVLPARREAAARVARPLLEEKLGTAARFVLEIPVTLVKMTTRQLLHAGALVGPRGAAVLRGPSGAGKSTLVAAGWKAGLGVLGDESILVGRDDTDSLESTLRDLALSPASVRLLGLEGAVTPAFSGGEEKLRLPLFASATPRDRLARRAATLLLGPRSPGPARLVPLLPEEAVSLFRAGEIPQERAFGSDPDALGLAWSFDRTYRLDGAEDLEGAVGLVKKIIG
jgi:hypothetical protein